LWKRSPLPGSDFHLLVGTKQSGGGYSMLRGAMDSSIPEHIHLHDDESIYMLEGSLVAQIEDERFDLGPGDFLYMPRGQRHQLIIESPIVMLNIQTPGGIMDALMDELLEYVEAGNDLTMEKYAEIQQKHGLIAPEGWVGSTGT
jgi:quercetin dioxygenase-like cupin family protein